MRGWSAVVAVGLALVWGAGEPIAARADGCSAACVSTRHGCLAAVARSSVEGRRACPRSGADRHGCVRAARHAGRDGRTACRAAAVTCRSACRTARGGACGARGTWLDAVNFYRGLARVPPVEERPDLSAGDARHAAYMVGTDSLGHDEDAGSPLYSAEGAQAATTSDVVASSDPGATDVWAIEFLVAAPFHALALLDPRLTATGFGIAHDMRGPIETAAAVDVLSARAAPPAGLRFPVLFPSRGAIMPLTRFPGGETPDPLTSCPGYAAPAGAPLVAQLGTGSSPPAVAAHRLARDGVPVEHCVFDETTYVNPDPALQSLGRAVLAPRNAIVIVPRAPLAPGSYAASVDVGARRLRWRFVVRCARPGTRTTGD